MLDRRWQLVAILRGSGSILLLAFLASLLPSEWMRTAHEAWLGMGPFPSNPLVEYLTRSVALLYGFHGVLVWISSFDIDRFRPIIWFNGSMNVLFGSGMVAIDLASGMPPFWTAMEGPGIALVGVGILALAYLAPRADVGTAEHGTTVAAKKTAANPRASRVAG